MESKVDMEWLGSSLHMCQAFELEKRKSIEAMIESIDLNETFKATVESVNANIERDELLKDDWPVNWPVGLISNNKAIKRI